MEDLRHGRATRERKLAICAGGAHLAPADRAELLAVLAGDADEMVSERAQDAILSQPIESFVEAIRREHALPALFSYAAKNLAGKHSVCDAMVQNKNCLAEAAAAVESDLAKRQTLIQRLAKMTVAQRVQFAMKGGSEARRTLIRDNNKVVQRAVLQSPRLTDQEVEAFASMSSLTDEILRLIANNRNFRKNYTVVRNLINNPKTPIDVSLHMLPVLNPIDLKRLTTNKNIPETLRTSANKLHRTRLEFKK